ncbi:MAG: retropepsin-like aspartic protease [Burkholderiaceae bacterium]
MSSSSRFGHIYLVLFWIAVMGVVWLAMERFMEPKKAVVTAQGDLVVPRHRDGHFYVDGTVNGRAVRFLIDTGASSVSITEALAREAGLEGGEPTTFLTANGPRPGRIVRGVAVTAGPLTVAPTAVGVGLVGKADDYGLLGQSFLSKFHVSMTREQMVLRRP